MQVRFEESNIPLSTARPGQSHAGGPGKFDFCCSKVYLCIFTLNLVLPEEFLSIIWAREMITIRYFLVSRKIKIWFVITNHKSLIRTPADVLSVWVNYIVKYIYICIMLLMHDNLNKLQNHIGKLFFCPPPK